MLSQMKNSTQSVWEGVYDSWEEASAVGKGFTSKRWLDRIINQLNEYKIERNNFGCTAIPPRPSLLPMLCSLTNPNSIVDLGGSSGWLWYYIKDSIQNITIKQFDIIELEEICEYFKNSNFHIEQPIRYLELNEIIDNYDILYTNSVLQYFKDEIVLNDIINKTKPKFILIDNFLGGMIDEYYSCQIYYEDRIPVKFRNSEHFIKNMIKIKYDLVFSRPYVSKIRNITQTLPMSKIPEKKRLRYGLSFLFKRTHD